MQTVPLSEFRAQVSAMVDLVEKGETVRILRHGKPVAELVPPRPVSTAPDSIPNWKKPFEPVVLPPGQSFAEAVRTAREERPW